MIRDLLNDIKVQLYERATSPLLISFVIAWCIWNYDFLLILLSDHEPVIKLIFIEKIIFPSDWSWVCWRVGGPLAAASAYIFVYPYPAQWVYRYTRFQHKRMKVIQQNTEDETPLTMEESRKIRASMRSIERQYDEQSDQTQLAIERLKSDLKAVEVEKDKISELLQSALNDQKSGVRTDITRLGIKEDEKTNLNEEITDENSSKINDPIIKKLDEIRELSEDKKLKFFQLSLEILKILDRNSELRPEYLSEVINYPVKEVRYVIEVLKDLKFVRIDALDNVSLNVGGNKYVVESDLDTEFD